MLLILSSGAWPEMLQIKLPSGFYRDKALLIACKQVLSGMLRQLNSCWSAKIEGPFQIPSVGLPAALGHLNTVITRPLHEQIMKQFLFCVDLVQIPFLWTISLGVEHVFRQMGPGR